MVVRIRPYQPSDAPVLAGTFNRAVRQIGSRH